MFAGEKTRKALLTPIEKTRQREWAQGKRTEVPENMNSVVVLHWCVTHSRHYKLNISTMSSVIYNVFINSNFDRLVIKCLAGSRFLRASS